MISEKTICRLLSSLLPAGRDNGCFESDAEVIGIHGHTCLFTTDEFSAEDLFREARPYDLGWNIAAGCISDIFACGGSPLYYAHALTVNELWDASFLGKFGAGVRDVLNATGTRFIGGDVGRSPVWRCTGSVIGSCEGRRVSRCGAAVGDAVYVSGALGAGNLEAALSLTPELAIGARHRSNRFALRQRESAVLREYASACIDTSDGAWAAVNSLADLNRCGYALQDPPYLAAGLQVLEALRLPQTLLFLGECGEYELLFTIPPGREGSFLAAARASGCSFHRLGRMGPRWQRVLYENGRRLDLGSLRIQARDFESPRAYLAALAQGLRAALKQAKREGPPPALVLESPRRRV
jgi:thiamine-monophosphate kinase